MTLRDLLATTRAAADALAAASSLPPQVALTAQLVGTALAVVSALSERGTAHADTPLTLDTVGMELVASIQRQLAALGTTSMTPP